jgi:hypothetical protein
MMSVIGALSLAGSALGQTSAVSVPGTLIEYDGWGLVPILEAGEVRSFLALRDEDQIVGENITAIWFQRQADDSWTGLAWNDGDHAAALKYVAIDLGLPTGWDENLVVEHDVISATPISPKPYAYGLYADDPLTPAVAASGDPAATAGALEEIGYAASSLGVIDGGGSSGGMGRPTCEYQLASTELLDAFAIGEEAELAQLGTFSDGVSQVIACCFPATRTRCTPWSDWSCTGWTYVGSSAALSACGTNCEYERTASRTRTCFRVSISITCNETVCSYDSTTTGQRRTTETVYDCSVPNGAAACPGAPSDPPQCDAPTRNVTTTSTDCDDE